MIILAHVGPPSAIFQLRNFDVPLMVLISGLSFGLSYKQEPYALYVWKRIKRLVFPVWLFLTVSFLVMFFTGFPTKLPSTRTLVSTYLLLTGTDYVWVIRVFLLVAMVSPFILKFCRNTKSHGLYFSILSAIYVVYELVLFFTKSHLDSIGGKVFQNLVLDLVPYAIVFAIGLRLTELSKKEVVGLAVGALVLFVAVGAVLFVVYGKVYSTQSFKYPPQIYYLSYGIGISSLLWLASESIVSLVKTLKISAPILFVAQNSIWVYLWHIPLIAIVHLPFYLKYPLVFVVASLVAFVQVQFVKQVLLPRISDSTTKRNVNMILTG